jgi:hypothetical protein
MVRLLRKACPAVDGSRTVGIEEATYTRRARPAPGTEAEALPATARMRYSMGGIPFPGRPAAATARRAAGVRSSIVPGPAGAAADCQSFVPALAATRTRAGQGCPVGSEQTTSTGMWTRSPIRTRTGERWNTCSEARLASSVDADAGRPQLAANMASAPITPAHDLRERGRGEFPLSVSTVFPFRLVESARLRCAPACAPRAVGPGAPSRAPRHAPTRRPEVHRRRRARRGGWLAQRGE